MSPSWSSFCCAMDLSTQDARAYNPDSHRLQLNKCREQHLITRQGIVFNTGRLVGQKLPKF
ncbi:hypothetical protein HID58_001024 [Brassica napus]|uniref:Uncharacterized protein n=1 Tax=Brassica napus TaxID=3708 RepID=A0ABQ8EI68_BRANA|nr:hypothetical protein HID58_001024 [Brassica napus]